MLRILHEILVQTGNYNEYWGRIEQLVIKYADVINKAENMHPHLISIEIDNSEEKVKNLQSDLENFGLSYRHRKIRFYTRKEIEEAEYVLIKVAFPWDAKNKYAEDYGTLYSDGICLNCKTGKIQKTPLIVPKTKASQYDICSLVPEIIISMELEHTLFENTCSGYEIEEVYDWKTKKKTSLKQLKITNILPKMSEKSKIIEEKCPECRRLFFDGVEEGVLYEKKDKERFKDFNYTQEQEIICWGKSIPRGMCIVSHKVVKLLIEGNIKKLRSIYFQPVHFV